MSTSSMDFRSGEDDVAAAESADFRGVEVQVAGQHQQKRVTSTEEFTAIPRSAGVRSLRVLDRAGRGEVGCAG
ncbi:hypothetical protein [Rhodococcus sp. UFZ-B548]|uniref:hypothetical protein n=1 Tax=Rhodococcus sp. UFZ-B548 TaxID=2742212 RepID=UPI0015F35274|nr:hypothetical protein [Rhodococcus sp. UFZ-B548]